jgi:predicted Zn-dependent protease
MPDDLGVRAAAMVPGAARSMRQAAAIFGLGACMALLLPMTLPANPPPAAVPPASLPATPPVAAAPVALSTDIPPQALTPALESLARQTGLQYGSADGIVSDQQTRGASAGLSADQALQRLLEGTGLRHEFLNPRFVRIVAITPTPEADAPLLPLEEVLVLARRLPKYEVAPASAKEQKALDAANVDLEARIATEHLLYGHPALDQYVQAVAERLLAVDQTDPASVHVRVIKGVDANAFALSNGSIYVTTALLAALDDEAQLAAVLGHELTHYKNCHALRDLREEHHQEVVARTKGTVINVLFALGSFHYGVYSSPVVGPQTMEIWARAAISGYSRELEREADDGGIRRMIAAGYDPSGALAALQHLADQTAVRPVDETPLYASHPRIEQRMASYRDLLAGELATAAGLGDRRREEYRTQLAQLPLDQVELLSDARLPDRAERLLAGEIASNDSGRAQFLKGELCRKRVPQTDASVQAALQAYERAVTLGQSPVSAYRQAGLLHRMRGESEAAIVAFQAYLERAPTAVDAPLVRIYLEELRTSSPEVKP